MMCVTCMVCQSRKTSLLVKSERLSELMRIINFIIQSLLPNPEWTNHTTSLPFITMKIIAEYQSLTCHFIVYGFYYVFMLKQKQTICYRRWIFFS
jgi:hypothetical protein